MGQNQLSRVWEIVSFNSIFEILLLFTVVLIYLYAFNSIFEIPVDPIFYFEPVVILSILFLRFLFIIMKPRRASLSFNSIFEILQALQ